MNFVLKKESGAWKVALDLQTLMSMGSEKMKEKGMTPEDMNKMQEELKNINVDSIKMMMEKAKQAMDSAKGH
jgi:hypothetical protein